MAHRERERERERETRRRLPLRITAAALAAVAVAICLYPLAAYALIMGPNSSTFYVGVYAVSGDFFTENANQAPFNRISITGGTLPSGISLEDRFGPQNNIKRFEGTAMPGTVGTYNNIVLSDSEDVITKTTQIIVEKGPQTIVCANQTVQMGSTVTLAPYSKDDNGNKIQCAAPHLPTYTFVSADPAIATVDPLTGLITPVSAGQANITVASGSTDSYEAAASISVTVDVTAAPPLISPVITASASTGGRISPSGSVTVPSGNDQAFTITPDAGYHIADVQIDGNSLGVMTAYTFTNVVVNHTIYAAFAPDQARPSGSSAEPAPLPPAHEKATIGHCADWANIRSGPGTDFDIIGKVYLGDTVELLQWDKSGEWCKVLYNSGNNVGWLHGKYIIPSK